MPRRYDVQVTSQDTTDTDMQTFGPFPFFGPVAQGDEQNPAAHGGVVYRDEEDGLYRLRAVNGPHEEIGPWQPL